MAAELPVLRALGGEVLLDGPDFALADHFSETRHELIIWSDEKSNCKYQHGNVHLGQDG